MRQCQLKVVESQVSVALHFQYKDTPILMREAIEQGALLSNAPLRQFVLRFAIAGFLRVRLGIIMNFFFFLGFVGLLLWRRRNDFGTTPNTTISTTARLGVFCVCVWSSFLYSPFTFDRVAD
jgi:hypothetical protein